MLSTDSVVDRSLPVLVALALTAGCFGGSSEFAASSAAPESGQPDAARSGHAGQPSAAGHGADSNASGHGASWSYEGAGGPAQWGHISADYSACSDGNRQSPIDLSSAQRRDLSAIVFGYHPSNLAIGNNGHTVQVDHYGDSYVSVGRWPYRLRQFHFHSPSEHTINGEYAEVEMHLVHQDDRGRLAVIGVMIESGAHNPAFDEAWRHLPADAGDAKVIEGAFVDPEALLPRDRNFYHYSGSLTTPPCSEGVSWYVMANAISMSPEQIARFQEIIDGNNRPVQARHGRALYATSNQ